MRLEDIAPGLALEGIAPSSFAHVLVVDEPAPDTLAVVYRDASGALGERLLCRADEAFVRVPARNRPWAFDAGGSAFQGALDACMAGPCSGGVGDGGSAWGLMESFVVVGRGTFLVDPGREGLGPYMMLVLGHGHGPGHDGDGRWRLVLVLAEPRGLFTVADPSLHRRLTATRAEDRPLLEEALQPLIANRKLRADAVAWYASLLVAERDQAAARPFGAPPRGLSPPVLHGAAVVVPSGLVPWLRRHGGAAPA